MLMANGCSTEHLKERLEILHNHIKRYVFKNTTDKCWQIIFNISYDVSIRSLFHVIERSLTTSPTKSPNLFSHVHGVCFPKRDNRITFICAF